MLVLLVGLFACHTSSDVECAIEESNSSIGIEDIDLYDTLEPMVNERQLTEEEEVRAVKEIIFKMSNTSHENKVSMPACDPFFAECSFEISE